MSLNKVMLIGNVGKDPEVKYLGEAPVQAGQQTPKVARFTLATTERYKGKDGNPVENTEWHNIVVWRNLADIVEKYVQKGSKLYVEGKIQSRSYENKDGQTIYRTEINAERIEMLGSKADAQPNAPQTAQASRPQNQRPFETGWKNPAARPAPAAAQMTPNYDDGKDDLPF